MIRKGFYYLIVCFPCSLITLEIFTVLIARRWSISNSSFLFWHEANCIKDSHILLYKSLRDSHCLSVSGKGVQNSTERSWEECQTAFGLLRGIFLLVVELNFPWLARLKFLNQSHSVSSSWLLSILKFSSIKQTEQKSLYFVLIHCVSSFSLLRVFLVSVDLHSCLGVLLYDCFSRLLIMRTNFTGLVSPLFFSRRSSSSRGDRTRVTRGGNHREWIQIKKKQELLEEKGDFFHHKRNSMKKSPRNHRMHERYQESPKDRLVFLSKLMQEETRETSSHFILWCLLLAKNCVWTIDKCLVCPSISLHWSKGRGMEKSSKKMSLWSRQD